MTIQEVFNQMTAVEVAQFCKNVTETRNIEWFFSEDREDLQTWIASAFVWKETKQGHDYWEAIACRKIGKTIEVEGIEYWTLA